SKASLYEAFPAVETRRLVERFEWHYTPKHGSWLDLAESELGVLTSQCLNRRIPNKQILVDEIAAWEHDRNANHTKADWQFTTKKPDVPEPDASVFVSISKRRAEPGIKPAVRLKGHSARLRSGLWALGTANGRGNLSCSSTLSLIKLQEDANDEARFRRGGSLSGANHC